MCQQRFPIKALGACTEVFWLAAEKKQAETSGGLSVKKGNYGRQVCKVKSHY